MLTISQRFFNPILSCEQICEWTLCSNSNWCFNYSLYHHAICTNYPLSIQNQTLKNDLKARGAVFIVAKFIWNCDTLIVGLVHLYILVQFKVLTWPDHIFTCSRFGGGASGERNAILITSIHTCAHGFDESSKTWSAFYYQRSAKEFLLFFSFRALPRSPEGMSRAKWELAALFNTLVGV